MRTALPTIIIALAGSSLAFPTIQLADAAAAGCPFAKLERSEVAPRAEFDPIKQKVDVSGVHAFVPPTTSDKRVSNPQCNLPKVPMLTLCRCRAHAPDLM